MGNDDPDAAIALERAEWSKKIEELVSDTAAKLRDLAVEDFRYQHEYNHRSRIQAHVEVSENVEKFVIPDIHSRFEEFMTAWIVDNKVHF
jgi:hypothetical protein